jgi:hypothetical protein
MPGGVFSIVSPPLHGLLGLFHLCIYYSTANEEKQTVKTEKYGAYLKC